jgi:hypothetical protein
MGSLRSFKTESKKLETQETEETETKALLKRLEEMKQKILETEAETEAILKPLKEMEQGLLRTEDDIDGPRSDLDAV